MLLNKLIDGVGGDENDLDDEDTVVGWDKHFLEEVGAHNPIGKVEHKKLLEQDVISKQVTISTEAFARLDRVNHNESYMDPTKINNTRGIYNPVSTGAQEYSGWSDDGLRKYNEIWNQVKADRATEKRKQCEQELLQRLRPQQVRCQPVHTTDVEIANELSDDEE